MATKNKLFPHAEEGRGTGRTTGAILSVLGLAISNQNTWFTYQDHHGTSQAGRFARKMAQDLCDAMMLKHMEFRDLGAGFIVRSTAITKE